MRHREEIVAKKEAMLAEKNELEMKKLRCSQHLNQVITFKLFIVACHFRLFTVSHQIVLWFVYTTLDSFIYDQSLPWTHQNIICHYLCY